MSDVYGINLVPGNEFEIQFYGRRRIFTVKSRVYVTDRSIVVPVTSTQGEVWLNRLEMVRLV